MDEEKGTSEDHNDNGPQVDTAGFLMVHVSKNWSVGHNETVWDPATDLKFSLPDKTLATPWRVYFGSCASPSALTKRTGKKNNCVT